ncbi:Crp/Fnr family transcriptional regulator [Rhodoplanes sp. TEM]|uniref:Crp/Fnr family transcriptional regulator n=1 Tax=Rhodoplanes tepidamans TaxID=200616 RepID=A0ABT5J6S4_RHOTP|nr:MULTISPECIES: Crp/Fnr family transcriptional regulator [Rhodoplanes]MDC7785208.1 Crp/Fnr family transcriptional regulator [Rhodoplanes tepidamans]MDC7986751.1 Crp/Fnr family transcriptional regulator [Rhodoplanes sp. TEM]MDQ0353466.1 CRP-like cAMP-binding protein [Rhodoplanes tepidamans]
MLPDRSLSGIVERMLSGPMGRHLAVRHLAAGQLVDGAVEEEDAGEGSLMVVRRGRLRHFVSFEGKELTLFMLEPGDAVYLHAGSALEVKKDAEVVVIVTTTLRTLARTDSDLALAVAPLIDRLLQKSIRMIEDMAFHGVKHRLIRALCEAADRDGRPVAHGVVLDAPPRAEDFAMQIGATRQSVSTVIAELGRSGLLRRFGAGSLVISDLGRLREQLATER